MFILIPVEAPPQIIDTHPTDSTVSDTLGGAIPVPLVTAGGMAALWVRETAASEGLRHNNLAALLGACFSGRIIPTLGPVVVTTLVADPARQAVKAECFGEVAITAMMAILGDLEAALGGADDGFQSVRLPDGWAARVRAAAAKHQALPVPPSWPWAEQAPDPVADLFAKVGIRVAPGVIPARH